MEYREPWNTEHCGWDHILLKKAPSLMESVCPGWVAMCVVFRGPHWRCHIQNQTWESTKTIVSTQYMHAHVPCDVVERPAAVEGSCWQPPGDWCYPTINHHIYPTVSKNINTLRRRGIRTWSLSSTRKRWNLDTSGDLRMKALVSGICQARLLGYLWVQYKM